MNQHQRPRGLLAASALLLAFVATTAIVAQAPIATGPVATGPVADVKSTIDKPTIESPPTDALPSADASRQRLSLSAEDPEAEIDRVIASMTLAEKIGQMWQTFPDATEVTPEMAAAIRAGRVGSLINAPDRKFIAEAQRIARQESPAGIPLLVGRDVIHGYRTIFPIPLGQAASWNPALIERAAAIAAREAQADGINWTFAPMVDVGRDPRWGRVAETLGEDPMLCSALAAAMVRGFQQEQDGRLHGLLACTKHFAAYGLSEGGRDYNRASLSMADLHNVYLPPFRAAIDAGAQTLMTSFSEINGVPGTAHSYLLQDVLRDRWKYQGLVVSDWNSVIEMVEHGYSANAAEAAQQAVAAGVDMEMVSTTFRDEMTTLVKQGRVEPETIDAAVRRILRVKLALASYEQPKEPELAIQPRSAEVARQLARESLVLLKNDDQALPLKLDAIERLAVIGPLADAPQEQLGCWALDGHADAAMTPLEALRDAAGEAVEILYAQGAGRGFSHDDSGIAAAVQAARDADAVVLVVGEDATLSGEARSRSELDLPGVQPELVRAVAEAAAGKPLIVVILSGRPLAIERECDLANAVLYAWHPGTMGGPAIADVLLGAAAPTGKLPMTMLRSVGQAPLYYAHANTGRPRPDRYRPMVETGEADLAAEFQYRSHYVDSDPVPLFPFGFGLSYTTFSYDDVTVDERVLRPGQTLTARARVTNTGQRPGAEIAQLYVRDLVAQSVRPVRELKAFRRVYLKPGQSKTIEFTLPTESLGYYDARGVRRLEAGQFTLWIGGDSTAALSADFELADAGDPAWAGPPAVARVGEGD